MGRLALIKLLRSRNVEYHDAKDVNALRALAKASDSGDPAPAPASAPPPALEPASQTSNNYDDWGRLQLLKECRNRNLDYKPIAKDVQALKQLLISSDTK